MRPAPGRHSRARGRPAVTPVPQSRRFAATPSFVSLRRSGDGGFLNIGEGTTHPGLQEDKIATTATTTPDQPVTYALLVIFTVDPCAEHLQDQQVIATRLKAGSRASTPRFTVSTFARLTERPSTGRSTVSRHVCLNVRGRVSLGHARYGGCRRWRAFHEQARRARYEWHAASAGRSADGEARSPDTPVPPKRSARDSA